MDCQDDKNGDRRKSTKGGVINTAAVAALEALGALAFVDATAESDLGKVVRLYLCAHNSDFRLWRKLLAENPTSLEELMVEAGGARKSQKTSKSPWTLLALSH